METKTSKIETAEKEPQLRIVILEDNPSDAELIRFELEQAGFSFSAQIVNNKDAFIKILRNGSPDIILSDYDIPQYTGIQALADAKKNCPDVPFILVTGAVTEDRAIEILTSGARDYVLKHKLSRLAPAVRRALEEAEEHQRRKKAEKELRAAHRNLEKIVAQRTADLQAEIAERKKTENKLETILETLPSAIIMVNAEKDVSYLNKRVMEFCKLGYIRIDSNARVCIMNAKKPDGAPCPMEESPIFRSLISGEQVRNEEIILENSEGNVISIMYSSAPLYDAEGKISAGITIFEDISNRKQIEERMKRLVSDLAFYNKELESFSYSVSHDLRAPLRAVDGFSAMLMKDLYGRVNEEETRKFTVIRDNIKRMNQLIDDLLDLSRVGRKEMIHNKIDMLKVAESAWQQQLSINPDYAGALINGHLPPAYGDSRLIYQVFSNFFSNAIKYTRKRKKAVIEIGGETKRLENVFYVKDNGVGFNMKFYDKLFGVFQRLHSENEYEGTGVGLAIAQRIIHRHGGQVWAEGKVGAGATFYFSLPNKQHLLSNHVAENQDFGTLNVNLS